MRIGILSDTHDRTEPAAAALSALRDAGAEFFLHCGDVGGERVLDLLAGLPAAFVWGNNDWDRPAPARYAQTLGIACGNVIHRLCLDGKQIAVTHGDDEPAVRRLLADPALDYLFTGHTHQTHDRRHGAVRWINPGALYRARPKTVALLDLQTDALEFLTIF